MRFTAFLALAALLFAQSSNAPSTFAVPGHAEWHDLHGVHSASTGAESVLFLDAFRTDIGEVQRSQNACQIPPEDVHTVAANFGRLGSGIMVSVSTSCMCAATGNCAIYAYVREQNRYRIILNNDDADGYGFALAKSQNDIPDIILVRNLSYREDQLTRFRYSSGWYSPQACETSMVVEGEDEPEVDLC